MVHHMVHNVNRLISVGGKMLMIYICCNYKPAKPTEKNDIFIMQNNGQGSRPVFPNQMSKKQMKML